jgi:hypothetical protein
MEHMNAEAIKDAEGWIADYKERRNPNSLRLAIMWLTTAMDQRDLADAATKADA